MGLFSDAVLCLESALYYYRYIAAKPYAWHLAADKNTSKSRFKMEYPAEELLAEKFMEIVTKLELIRDLGVYYEVYRLLHQDGIDARRVKEQIETLCAAAGVEREWRRMEMIAGYQHFL